MNKVLPLPVKKDKIGRRVAGISTTEYYHQIAEEVLEAYENAVISAFVDKLNREKIVGDNDKEAE